MRRIPRNANDCSGKGGRATKARKRRKDTRTISFEWRDAVLPSRARSSHTSLVCTLRFSLQTTYWRWRRSDAIWGCWLRYSCCISAENHLLFSLNSPPFIVCIGVQRQPEFFSIDQRLICALNTEIRCTALRALGAFRALGAGLAKDRLPTETWSSLLTSSKREKLPQWKKKTAIDNPLHPYSVLELKFSVSVCWCQTVTVTTKGIYLKMENEENWCKKWTTNHFSWFQIFFSA